MTRFLTSLILETSDFRVKDGDWALKNELSNIANQTPQIQSQKPSLSIVIPCYNEEAAIPEVLGRVHSFAQSPQFHADFSSLEVIVVDDGSTDKSRELLKEFTYFKIVHHTQNKGYGGALKTGFSMAKGDLVAFLDMDSSYDPYDIFELFKALKSEKTDIAFGNRMRAQKGMPVVRGIGNSFYKLLVNLLFGTRMSDVCTGLRLFKKSLVPSVVSLPTDGLNYSIDFTLKVIQEKIPHSELAVSYSERSGESKLNEFKDGFAFLLVVLKYAARKAWPQ